jgi:tungstate transport system ATP-binding protein
MSLSLSIRDVTKSYGGREVLKGCTYDFERGVYALMGQNGAGKSTLLRVCALLEPPDGGEVLYRDGEGPAADGIALRRRVTLVMPRAGIFNTTVLRNAAYGLKLRGVGRREREERAFEALRAVGLSPLAGQNALTISSGETQRLALARALALGPEVLFLDEPTASVDEENVEIVEGLILDMKRRGSPVVVMATHDREQAARLADRTIRMKGGALIPQP